MNKDIKGKIHSVQSLGTVDGPGVRFVVFLQGCNLRCGCCHNPDSQGIDGGILYTPREIYEKAERCRAYFGKDGGITLSGGEPLLQAEFSHELFRLCHEGGINTCLDTSGSILNGSVKALLRETDRVLLDIKYTNNSDYLKYAGCSLDTVLNFLGCLSDNGIKTTLRQVIIPTLNDSEENIIALKKIKESHPVVDKVELLPFKKICSIKYEKLNIPFPFAHLPTPDSKKMLELRRLLEV